MAVRRARRLLIVAASLVGVSVVVWAVPPLRARAKALGVIAEASGISFPRPWARSVEVHTTELAPGLVGDMYVGSDDAPVILFVPGAALRGREDPRVVSAATALAKGNRRVFVPELELYDRTFRRSDIDRLARAMELLSEDGPIGIVGFSYGGSFSLIAASQTGNAADISFIATFGAYFDLGNLIQAVTTGSTLLEGEQVAFETIPEARTILTRAAIRLAADRYADDLEAAIESEDPSRLSPDAKTIYDLLVTRDPARTEQLVAALPDDFSATLEDFSPSNFVERLEAPVFIMQSRKDAATPWTEAVLLADALPRSRVVTLEHFSHVDPPGIGGWATDGPKAWWFVSWILEAQE
ncbi:MAG: alpha/beta hydrolase [Actinomycetota bacterium]|nr:alpha/beta hydrolase [Actinomycetota bacterium]